MPAKIVHFRIRATALNEFVWTICGRVFDTRQKRNHVAETETMKITCEQCREALTKGSLR